ISSDGMQLTIQFNVNGATGTISGSTSDWVLHSAEQGDITLSSGSVSGGVSDQFVINLDNPITSTDSLTLTTSSSMTANYTNFIGTACNITLAGEPQTDVSVTNTSSV